MNKERTYLSILAVLITLFVLAELMQPEPTDWSDGFSATEQKPYGGYLIKGLLPSAFPEDSIHINNQPIFELSSSSNQDQSWIFIHSEFGLDQFETEILLDKIRKGDHVFIGARSFSQAFADSLNLDTQFGNPLVRGQSMLDNDSTTVYLTNPALSKSDGWTYQQTTTEAWFTSTDTSRSTILGRDSEGRANFIRQRIGDGAVYLHSNPTLFTNFVVRDEIGARYAVSALSYLPGNMLVWDEYYKPGRLAGQSAVQFVVSTEYLRSAWFLMIAGVVLFMIFKGRREQKIIPEAKSPTNSSLEFARTIGHLYLEQGTHKDMAEKKIRYLLDYIRSNLGLDTDQADQDFLQRLSMRSGLDLDELQSLFATIQEIQTQDTVSVKELTDLSKNIDQFYKHTKR